MGWGRAMRILVTLLFVVSGLVALAYEVVWVRALGLVVGNSLWAAIAVVAAYMGGMAAGSYVVARAAGRIRHHLRLYATAETLAAATALVTGPVLTRLGTVTAVALGEEPLAHLGVGLLGRFLVAWVFLAVPTLAMGATLPLLVARLTGRDSVVGSVSALYAANTFGAVAGVVLAGFLGLPNLGESGTLAAAGSLGLIVALVAFLAEGYVPDAAQPLTEERPAHEEHPGAAAKWLAYPALYGFVALAAELVWTRLLQLNLGSRVYAFAVILAVYLLGIALGAVLARFGKVEPTRALVTWQLALGVAFLVQIPLFANFGSVLAWLPSHFHLTSFSCLQLSLAAGVAVALLPATIAFGASFPLAVAAFPGGAAPGRRTGLVAAANTGGAILGAVVAPLLLVPLVGTQRLLVGLALASVVAATLLHPRAWVVASAGTVAVVGLLVVALLPRDTVLRGAQAVAGGTVEVLRESATATVVIHRVADARGTWRSLELNGVNVAGTSRELWAIQRLQGHLPLLLHPAPTKVLHIGFGSGGTAWAVAQHPVEQITIAEISPEVLEVSDSAFSEINHGVLRDPRVRVRLNDGRNVLLASKERFDVILSDSIHPVYAGNSTLYTREYFQLCRDHLSPDGVISMWLPMYSLADSSFLGILRAFSEVFPGTAVWYDPVVLNEFTVVTGTLTGGPLQLRWDALADPRLIPTLAEAGVRGPATLASMLLLGPNEVASLVAEVLPHVDDFPEVEYRSGRLLDRDGAWLSNFRILYAMRARSDPFASLPASWSAVQTARDDAIRAQLRELKARIGHSHR
jgi:spermidine synthase